MEPLVDDTVWLGDMSGFEIYTDNTGALFLYHRCGWSKLLLDSEFLANITMYAMKHRKNGCETY